MKIQEATKRYEDFSKICNELGVTSYVPDIFHTIRYFRKREFSKVIYNIQQEHDLLEIARKVNYPSYRDLPTNRKEDKSCYMAFYHKIEFFSTLIGSIKEIVHLKSIFNVNAFEDNIRALHSKLIELNNLSCQLINDKEILKPPYEVFELDDSMNAEFINFILSLDYSLDNLVPASIITHLDYIDLEGFKNIKNSSVYWETWHLIEKMQGNAREVLSRLEYIEKINFEDLFVVISERLQDHEKNTLEKSGQIIFEQIISYFKIDLDKVIDNLNEDFKCMDENLIQNEFYVNNFLNRENYSKVRELIIKIYSCNDEDVVKILKDELLEILNQSVFAITNFNQVENIRYMMKDTCLPPNYSFSYNSNNQTEHHMNAKTELQGVDNLTFGIDIS